MDLGTREGHGHLVSGHLRNARCGADHRDWNPELRGDLATAPNELGPAHAAAQRSPEHGCSPGDGHAVCDNQVHLAQQLLEVARPARLHHEVDVARNDLEAAFFENGPLDQRENFVERDHIERTAQDVDSLDTPEPGRYRSKLDARAPHQIRFGVKALYTIFAQHTASLYADITYLSP